jgi:hypothetical protein
METQFKVVAATPNKDQHQRGIPAKETNKEQDLNKGGLGQKEKGSQQDQRKGGK